MSARCLTHRERAVVGALADAMAAPAPPLPPVAETDAVDSVDAWLARAPGLNRAAVRAGLIAVGLAPIVLARGRRLLELDREQRSALLQRLSRNPVTRDLIRVLASMLVVGYYGDAGVSRLLGYDAAANVERGRRLIAAEGRPA